MPSTIRKPAGFTLIELLVTVSIIGLMLAVASIYYSNAQVNGRDAQRISDTLLIGQAIDESTTAANGTLPSYQSGGSTVPTVCADALDQATANHIDASIFSSKGKGGIPIDPKPLSQNTARSVTDCTNGTYGTFGYTYAYSYVDSSGTLRKSADLRGGNRYILEIALERTLSSDEAHFRMPSQLGLSADTLPVGSTSPSRNVYILPGPLAP